MASNPEIPSFKNPKGDAPGAEPAGKPEKKEEKKSGIPLFKDTGSAPKGGAPFTTGSPTLKVRGLAGAPRTLLERLKQFQKKDLVFIASGLGVLFMAPLAEHFMMSPSQDKGLQPGFSQPGSAFTDVGVHEPGAGGMSPGSVVGGGSDIITPLNVRDPSALVMAPGAAQATPPPAAATVAPPPASASRDSGGWKDALSAAKSGAEKGADAAKPAAFRAPGNLAGALRGLSALAGGSYGGGPSYALPPPSASNVPNRPGGGGNLSQVTSAPGYSGVSKRGEDQGSNSAEALRKAAENAAGLFNRGGSAAGNLEAASKEAMPGGSGSSSGGPGGGGENKAPGGSNSKDNKSLGESLAFIKLKMEMEKELDLKWSKKKWKEFEFPKMIYEEITKSAISNIIGKGFLEPFAKKTAGVFLGKAPGSSGVNCYLSNGKIQEFPDQDDLVYGCLGGNGPNVQVYSQGLAENGVDRKGAQNTTGLPVCAYCGQFGDSNRAEQPDPNRNNDRTDRGSGVGSIPPMTSPDAPAPAIGANWAELAAWRNSKLAELKAEVERCGGKASGEKFKPSCDAAKGLYPLFPELDGVFAKGEEANKALSMAWLKMKGAVEGMQVSVQRMAPVTKEFGEPPGRAGEESVLGQSLSLAEWFAQPENAAKAPAYVQGQVAKAQGARQHFALADVEMGKAAQLYEPIGKGAFEAGESITAGRSLVTSAAELLKTKGEAAAAVGANAGLDADQTEFLGTLRSKFTEVTNKTLERLEALGGKPAPTGQEWDAKKGGLLGKADLALRERVDQGRRLLCGEDCGLEARTPSVSAAYKAAIAGGGELSPGQQGPPAPSGSMRLLNEVAGKVAEEIDAKSKDPVEANWKTWVEGQKTGLARGIEAAAGPEPDRNAPAAELATLVGRTAEARQFVAPGNANGASCVLAANCGAAATP